MREFVEKMLHVKVECEPVDVSGLPLYLRGLYSFERWTAFGVPFAMAYPIESSTVKTMAKHRNALETALGIPVAFAFESATGYRVERMLEAGLAFVTLGRQVYLPFLGISLNGGEGRAASRQQASIETLSPQAQRLALIALYGDLDGTSVTQAASILATAKMTASRAFDELAAVDPSIVATEGRRRVLHPERNKMALWRRLEPYMTSPVAREYRLAYIPDEDLPLGRPLADIRCDQNARARLRTGSQRARRWIRRVGGTCVRGAGTALRTRAGARVYCRSAFRHSVPFRRREG